METPPMQYFLHELVEYLNGLTSECHVKIYYDPETWVFYFYDEEIFNVHIPQEAVLISFGRPEQFYTNINRMLTRDCQATKAATGGDI